jgi:hypothetical protein
VAENDPAHPDTRHTGIDICLDWERRWSHSRHRSSRDLVEKYLEKQLRRGRDRQVRGAGIIRFAEVLTHPGLQ